VQVTCPACRGRKLMDYWADQPLAPIDVTSVDIATTVDILRDQPCRECNGEGKVAATRRIAVMQDGRRIGTVMPSFDPDTINSRNPLYRPRPGDFRREGDVWIAHPMLGNGDLEAVPGFVWDR
jgi:hypothetical protein